MSFESNTCGSHTSSIFTHIIFSGISHRAIGEGGGWKGRLEHNSRVSSGILWKPYHLRYGKYNLMIFLSFSDIQ